MRKNGLLLMTAPMVAGILFSCRSVKDFDRTGAEAEPQKESATYGEELSENYGEVQSYLIQEKMKEVDIPKTVVYVDRPVYYPVERESDRPMLRGKDAVRESTRRAEQSPSKFSDGMMYYDFDSDFTYEIYCQPYRVTDIMLEPGEQVIEMPFLSEEKVWEIGAGVSKAKGVDTQHFFLKPAYSGLVTSFIIITDRRIYHMLLKSFKDCYMTQVKWNYPNTMPFTVKTDAMQENVNRLSKETVGVDPAYLSFDYRMSYSFFKKPYWLPQRVYDDGRRTYITMNETVLHMVTPVLFNKRNEVINYSVNKNLIVVNSLIEKITLRVGSQKVIIRKKSYKEPKEINVSPEERRESEDIEIKDEKELPPDRKMMLHTNGLIKKEEPKHETENTVPPVTPEDRQ